MPQAAGPVEEHAKPDPAHTGGSQHQDDAHPVGQQGLQEQHSHPQDGTDEHPHKAGEPNLEGLLQGALHAHDAGDAGIGGAHIGQHPRVALVIEEAERDKDQVGEHHCHGGLSGAHPDIWELELFHGADLLLCPVVPGPAAGAPC